MRREGLVGREGELAAARQALDGEPGSVALVGEAGVGKTALLRTLRTELLAAGAVVPVIRATTATAAIPFGAFAAFVPDGLSAASARVDVLRRVAGELRGGDGDRDRRRVVVMVDDVHLLEDASLALVHHLVAQPWARLVVTARSGELAEPVRRLWRDGLVERVDVAPLGELAAGDLLADVVGAPVDEPTRYRLWQTSGGNPLVLRSLAEGGVEAGLVRLVGSRARWHGPLRIQPAVTELVEDRLVGLSGDERAALDLLALAEDLDLTHALSLVDEDVLAGLERRGLVTAEGERLRLAHPLYGEVVRASQPTVVRHRLLKALADTLAAAPHLDATDRLRLAVWRFDAGEPLEPTLAIAAAQRALALSDHGLAERLASSCAVASVPAAVTGAEALYWQGRYAEAETLLAGVSGLDDAPPPVRARAAIVRSSALFWGLGDAAAAEQVAADAGASEELRGHRATLAFFAGEIDRALALAGQVLDGPQGAPTSPTGGVRAAVAAVAARAVAGGWSTATALADRWLPTALEVEAELPSVAGELMLGRCIASLLAGHLDDAESVAREVHRVVVVEGAEEYRGTWALLVGRVLMARSRFAEARRWLADAAELLAGSDPAGVRSWAEALAGQAAALLGDDAEAAERLAAAERHAHLAVVVYRPEVLLADAWRLALAGRRDDGVARAEEAVRVSAAMGAHGLEALALHDLARLGSNADRVGASGGAGPAPARGEPDRAGAGGRTDPAGVADRLGELVRIVEGPAVEAYAAHAAALGSGRPDEMEAAGEGLADLGALLAAAETFVAAAEAHERVGSGRSRIATAGRRPNAPEGRDRAARRCASRAAALLAQCEGGRTPRAVRPGRGERVAAPLTAREREIVALAARGLSNREIAERLVVSIRTVGNHLNHAYAKLGATSRHDLARLAGWDGADEPVSPAE